MKLFGLLSKLQNQEKLLVYFLFILLAIAIFVLQKEKTTPQDIALVTGEQIKEKLYSYTSYNNPNILLTNPSPINEEKEADVILENFSILNTHSPLIGIIYLDPYTIKYKVQSGDTFKKIAQYFNTTEEAIKETNRIKSLKKNSWIIIKTKTQQNTTTFPEEKLPLLKNFFLLPAVGKIWKNLHYYNAIDISNTCGTPVYAALPGVVVEENGSINNAEKNSYGIFVLLEHPNGIKTRYANLQKSLVKIGDIVEKGSKIGLMGNSGDNEGINGCHLHFEIYGARNPFAN